MKTWFRKFWYLHGERIIFGGLALFLGGILFALGTVYGIEQFKSTGEVIATGVAMLLFNKARGSSIEEENKE
jgi:hypothetical protein